MDDLHCVSLHQPWATLVAKNFKRIETRSHPMLRNRIGERVGIASTKRKPEPIREHGHVLLGGQGRWEYQIGYADPAFELPLGALVCTAVVTAVLPMLEHGYLAGIGPNEPAVWVHPKYGWMLGHREVPTGDVVYGHWEHGRWAIVLADIEPVNPPIPVSGLQGVWKLSGGIRRAGGDPSTLTEGT